MIVTIQQGQGRNIALNMMVVDVDSNLKPPMLPNFRPCLVALIQFTKLYFLSWYLIMLASIP